MLSANQLRQKYLDFFVARGHKVIPSAPIVLANDPTTLFTGSGMQPMMPYLLGQPHPLGTRLTDSQKSFRAGDIEEVGDNRHTTFFEMLGNWSLGDYFKKEQLSWFFEFLTKELGLDPKRLYVTVFIGDEKNGVGKDTESIEVWQKLFADSGIDAKEVDFDTEEKGYELGMQDSRIFAFGVKKNWWARNGAVPATMPSGEPGGPDSEVFYDFGTPHDPKFGKECHPNCDCGRFLEIGNSVFMLYQKQADGSLKELAQKNVDFGGGFERILAAIHHDPDIFNTDLFKPIIKEIEKFTGKKYKDYAPEMRVIADHIKAATFMIYEGLEPSNKQQGYLLRRLIRRSAIKMHRLGGGLTPQFSSICRAVFDTYRTEYNGLDIQKWTQVSQSLDAEMSRFAKSLDRGLKEFDKADISQLNALFAFNLYQTYGFPVEISQELFQQKGIQLDMEEFNRIKVKHQDLSRTASEGFFKGGLADHSEVVTQYHTATHLLHQALRQVLGDKVHQAGSNLTSERLRFDFTYDKALTPEELKKVEDIVNEKISADLPVKAMTMSYDEAIKSGALAFFKEKYPDQVTVYTIGTFSKELCGGPHVAATGEIGKIKIVKQESLGSSGRRIYLTKAS